MVRGSEILLVDDTPDNLRVLSEVLEGQGFLVRVARNGRLALRSVQARPPDIILLDIRMPEMDGFEVCRRLREDPLSHDIPILFLSASEAAEDRILAFRIGGVDFIGKPFQAEEVLARVSTHLQLARMRQVLAAANLSLEDRVREEGALRQRAEAQLDLALQAAGMGTWEVDVGTGRMGLDARACALLDVDPAGPPPRWADFWATAMPDAQEEPFVDLGRFAADAEVRELEGWLQLGGAEQRRLRLRGSPLATPTGGARVIGVVWDVTHEHRLRERLAQGEKLEALGQLAGSVAHDFNNQLAVILGEAEILAWYVSSPPRAREGIENIVRAATLSAEMTRDLLTYARRRALRRERIDLAVLLRQVVRMAASLAGGSITLRSEIPDGQVVIEGDAGQFQNAVLNLCLNARDAMPAGGDLTVALSVRELEATTCGVCGHELSGRFAAVDVIDTGTGIPEHLRARIFEPFFTTKPEGRGTGLGLSAVYGFVASHGGHVLLESTLGVGTRFTLLLAPAPPREAASDAPRSQAAAGGHLLVVDDQQAVRDVLALALRRFGYDVSAFGDPDAAVAAFEAAPESFDLVLADMLMPGMDGSEVLRRVRRARADARVILMSGCSIPDEALAARPDAVIEKPVALQDLTATVARVMGGGGA